MSEQTEIALFSPGDIIVHKISKEEAIVIRFVKEEYHVSMDSSGVRTFVKDYIEIGWELKPKK